MLEIVGGCVCQIYEYNVSVKLSLHGSCQKIAMFLFGFGNMNKFSE